MIRVPLQQHETESEVYGVAFDVTHEEDIVVLRHTPHLDPSFQIEVYSRNGDLRNVNPLYASVESDVFCSPCCLLSNPKGIVAVIQDHTAILFGFSKCWHLVGKVFLKP